MFPVAQKLGVLPDVPGGVLSFTHIVLASGVLFCMDFHDVIDTPLR